MNDGVQDPEDWAEDGPSPFNDDLEEAPEGNSLTLRSGGDRGTKPGTTGGVVILSHDLAHAAPQTAAVREIAPAVARRSR